MQPAVWISTLVSLVTFAMTFYITYVTYRSMHDSDKFINRDYVSSKVCPICYTYNNQTHCQVHWTEILIFSLFSFTEPESLPWFTNAAITGRLLVLTWGISCLTLNMAFNSNLRAVLLKPVTEEPVENIADGIERGTNMWSGHFVPDPNHPEIISQWFIEQ